MNKFFFAVAVFFLLQGCTDERSGIIESYLQTYYRTQPDLTFTIKQVRSLSTIDAGDSLAMLETTYVQKRDKFMKEYNELLASSLSLKNSQKERAEIQASMDNAIQYSRANTDSVDSDKLKWISDLEKRASEGSAAALVYKQKQLIELRHIAQLIARYKKDTGVILARTANVTYVIHMPAPDKKRIEEKRTLIFSPDNKKVLGVAF